MPTLEEDTDVAEAYRVLLSGESGVIVTRNGAPVGVITRADLINHWQTKEEKP
jgi:cystathionine beta-synthase